MALGHNGILFSLKKRRSRLVLEWTWRTFFYVDWGGEENLIHREKSQGWAGGRKVKVSKSKQRMPYAHLGKAR